jgi:hypothetical protein
MSIWKRLLCLLALLLGIVGTIACIAAIVLAFSVNSRMCGATDRLFEKLESTTVRAQDRVARIRERVDAAKLTAKDIKTSLEDWAKKATAERVAVRLEIAKKSERLAPMLQQVGQWLEASGSACELVQQGLSIAASAGAVTDSARIDTLVEDLKDLRAKITDVEDAAARIRDWTAEKEDSEPVGKRIDQVVLLTVRVTLTLGTFDSRLDKLDDRLTRAKEGLQESKAKTVRRIHLATGAVVLVILWLAAGQIALAYIGGRGIARRRSGQYAIA